MIWLHGRVRCLLFGHVPFFVNLLLVLKLIFASLHWWFSILWFVSLFLQWALPNTQKKLNNNISRECDHYHKKDRLEKTKHIWWSTHEFRYKLQLYCWASFWILIRIIFMNCFYLFFFKWISLWKKILYLILSLA